MAHLVKLVRSRTLHLQRVVASNPYNNSEEQPAATNDLLRRVEDLEARNSIAEPVGTSASEPIFNGKQTAVLTTEIRRNLQPDLDALNRAVRRYEKRATLQTFQTESRLLDLEARLNDAISLAAAAANNGQNQRGFTSVIIEWVATAIVLPVHAFTAIARLPFRTIVALISYGKTSIAVSDKSEKKESLISSMSHMVATELESGSRHFITLVHEYFYGLLMVCSWRFAFSVGVTRRKLP